MTENICKRLLDYNLHKERSGSNRFAKVSAACSALLPGLPHLPMHCQGTVLRLVLAIAWIPCQHPAREATLPPQVRCGEGAKGCRRITELGWLEKT